MATSRQIWTDQYSQHQTISFLMQIRSSSSSFIYLSILSWATASLPIYLFESFLSWAQKLLFAPDYWLNLLHHLLNSLLVALSKRIYERCVYNIRTVSFTVVGRLLWCSLHHELRHDQCTCLPHWCACLSQLCYLSLCHVVAHQAYLS